jgi:methanogenic corrinoid protein MtbC1
VEPALVQLDALWERNRISSSMQHLATAIIELAIARSYTEASWPMVGPTFVVACAPGEDHGLGARMVSDLLAQSGWTEMFLGPDTAADAMVRAVTENAARAIGISVTMNRNLANAHACIVRLRRVAPAIKVLVGGRACAELADPVVALGADAYAPTAREAVDVAENWKH